MNTVKDVSQYPWLCSTVSRLDDDLDNIVCPNEEDTDDVLIQDAYEKFGITCVYYRVTEDLLRDKLFGEDQLKYIQRSWYFNGYVEQLPPNVRSYQLQGIWGEDVVRMFASIDAFNYYSTYGGYDKNTPEVYEEQPPSIGDIIYIPANETFYRIVDVKYYEQAFGLKPHTYTFTLKVYKDNKWTISGDSPTLSNVEDPIYTVANYPLPSCYQIDDPLKVQPVVSEDARPHSDPYNDVNVLYDPDAHARNQMNRLQKEIEAASEKLAYELSNLYTSAGITQDEANEYIGKVNDYRETNEKQISEISSDIDTTNIAISGISADGKTLTDIAGNEEIVYYVKEP